MNQEVQNADVNSHEQAPKISAAAEFNFRKMEAILAQERAEKEELRRENQRLQQERASSNDEEDDSQPYVDNKNLNKKLKNFEQQTFKETDSRIEARIHKALQEERKNAWLENHNDFYETLKHA